MEFLAEPLGLAIAAACVLGLLVMLIMRRGGPSRAPAHSLGNIDKLVKKGNYAEAAAVARREGKNEEAIEYYLRAQQPQNAAHIAERMGNARQAAELYERAHNYRDACRLYERAGITEKAEELRQTKLDPLLDGALGASPSLDETPTSNARKLEKEFRAKLDVSGNSDTEKAELQRFARQVADALLAEGDLKRAADVYRDAELDDEAIHLYVNILGSPGEAAPILSARGNHQRAAELYELAGQKERAAASWVTVAEAAPQADSYIDRIEQLSPKVATRFLEKQTAARPLAKETLELHYRFGSALQHSGDSQRALEVFTTIQDTMGPYRDIAERLTVLKGPGLTEPPGDAQETPSNEEDAAAAPSTDQWKQRLSDDELQSIAMQVAKAAAEQLNRGTNLLDLMANASVPKLRSSHRTDQAPIHILGLEQNPVELKLVADDAVDIARAGPSISSLLKFIDDRECDLQNIEVYYRLGLAYLATGDWNTALNYFDQVDEASPGYRDAYKRADEIRNWREALGPNVTGVGTFDGPTQNKETRYELHGELGRGGMAVVYRGRDTLLDRDVALKFLASQFSEQDEMQELFQREARSVAQLNHPNIVTIHDFGILEGRAFICMEYVEGKPVEQLLETEIGLTIVESCRIIKQALDALAYAHDRKIIHRDVKPANMMRTTSGLVKLMDFGLAKSVAESNAQSFVAGTPAYMPPEQLAGTDVDHRTDLFALGVTLYEMLTMQLPFDGLQRDNPPICVSEHVPAIPSILDEAIMRSIELDPADRFQSAAEFAEPLEQILQAVSKFASAGRASASADDASREDATDAVT